MGEGGKEGDREKGGGGGREGKAGLCMWSRGRRHEFHVGKNRKFWGSVPL